MKRADTDRTRMWSGPSGFRVANERGWTAGGRDSFPTTAVGFEVSDVGAVASGVSFINLCFVGRSSIFQYLLL